MALDAVKNFAISDVSTGYDGSATSIVLASGGGAKFPAVPFNAVWWNKTDYPNPALDPNVEIVRVTAISTDTLTVTRGQESISATTKNTGGKTYAMHQSITAKMIGDLKHPILQLDYVETTDIANGLAIGNGSWSDLCSNQNFSVSGGTAALLEVSMRGAALCGFGVAAEIASRLNIDSGGTPVYAKMNGTTTGGGAGVINPIGGGKFWLTGLAAGTHTVKVQLFADAASNVAYCRCSSFPNTESLAIQVVEF